MQDATQQTSRQARQTLVDALNEPSFSGVCRVTIDGQSAIDHASGHTRRHGGEPITPGTRFATASVTKMFTAAAIARLVDRGRCTLDQPLADHLPDLRDFLTPDHTFDALLTHTSGLGDYIDDDAELPFAGMPVARLDHAAAFIPYLRRVGRDAAGEFAYSSAGFVLLGLAIEAISATPYPQAIDELVVQPAGLTHTRFDRVDADLPGYAWGYLDNGDVNHPHTPIVGGPDGGIVTSADDLHRLLAWLKHADAMSSTMRAALWEHVSRFDNRNAYGRGFFVNDFGGRTWVGHTGGDPGVSARTATDVASDTEVLVLCNRSAIAFKVFRHAVAWMDALRGEAS